MNILIINAYTKEEALEEAERRGFTAYKNLTSYWAMMGRPTGSTLTTLIANWLEKNDLSYAEGSVYIRTKIGVCHKTKGRAKISRFKIENIKTFHKVVEIRDENGCLYARTSFIADGMKLLRKQTLQYRKTLIARVVKAPDNYDDSIIAKSEFLDTSSLRKSTYMFFGNYKKKLECEV